MSKKQLACCKNVVIRLITSRERIKQLPNVKIKPRQGNIRLMTLLKQESQGYNFSSQLFFLFLLSKT